jgi:hypothetical protein
MTLEVSAVNVGALNAGTSGALIVAPATSPLNGTLPTRMVTVVPG